MKKILWICLLIGILALPVSAHEVPDVNRQGSIGIAMRYNGSPVAGGTLTLYRTGDILENDGNYGFVLSEQFAEAGISLDSVQSPETAKKLALFAKQHSITGQTGTISSDGKLEFEKLQPGLYLLVQSKAAQGYYSIKPFLVSVPMSESGSYSYHVDASPKVSPLPKPPADNQEQPKTGQSGWPIWTFILSGAALIVLIRRKRAI